jgi:hypothetical protein
MGVRGPKGYGEELKIKQRYADLSDKVFAFYIECFEKGDKADKKWAAEQVAKGLVKMIPQDLTSGGQAFKYSIVQYGCDDSLKIENGNTNPIQLDPGETPDTSATGQS